MSNQVANYYAGFSFKTDNASFAKAEQRLKKLEAQLKKYKMQFKGLDHLVIKPKVEFKSLALQKELQTSLNKINRLLRVELSNFTINQDKLNHQLQAAFNRASQNIKLNVKSIAGQAGGAGIRPVFLQPHSQGGYGFGMGGMAARVGLAGLAGFGAAGAAGAGIGAAGAGTMMASHAFAQNATQAGSEYSMMNAQFKAASGDKWKESLKRYEDLTNYLGLSTTDNSRDWTKSLQSLNDAKMQDSEQFLSSMFKFSRGAGLSSEQIKLMLNGISQAMGKNQLMAEEWGQQIADQLPGANKFASTAWAMVKGTDPNSKTASADFKRDMKDRKIVDDKLVKFFSILGQLMEKESNRGGRLDAAVATPDAQHQRLENIRKANWAAASNYNNGALLKSTTRLRLAYAELNKNMQPLYERTSIPVSRVIEGMGWTVEGMSNNLRKFTNMLDAAENTEGYKSLSKEWGVLKQHIEDAATAMGLLNSEQKDWDSSWLDTTYEMLSKIVGLMNTVADKIIAIKGRMDAQANRQSDPFTDGTARAFGFKSKKTSNQSSMPFPDAEKYTFPEVHFGNYIKPSRFSGEAYKPYQPKPLLPDIPNSLQDLARFQSPLKLDMSQFQMPSMDTDIRGAHYGSSESGLNGVMQSLSNQLELMRKSGREDFGPVTFQNTFNLNEASDAKAVADTVNRTLQSQFTDVLTAFPNQR